VSLFIKLIFEVVSGTQLIQTKIFIAVKYT